MLALIVLNVLENIMAKFFKEESYDLTQVHQALGYDSKAEYRHNRNLPTSHAIRRLGAE